MSEKTVVISGGPDGGETHTVTIPDDVPSDQLVVVAFEKNGLKYEVRRDNLEQAIFVGSA